MYNIHLSWLASDKSRVKQDIHPYWTIHDDQTVIDSVELRGKRIVKPASLKHHALDELHIHHMGIDRTCLLACVYRYWMNINDDIEKAIETAQQVLNFCRHTQRRRD